MSEIVRIPTRGGYVIKMDQEDFDKWGHIIWRINTSKKYIYPYTYHQIPGHTTKQVYLHRLITNCPKGFEVDHINHDTLDCTRANLRIVNRSQNLMNRGCLKKNKIGLKNVFWRADIKRWIVKVTRDYKIITKSFKDLKEAALYANEAITLLHGQYAVLNDLDYIDLVVTEYNRNDK
jgi:hypothetical protein